MSAQYWSATLLNPGSERYAGLTIKLDDICKGSDSAVKFVSGRWKRVVIIQAERGFTKWQRPRAILRPMQTLIIALLLYLAFGAVTCATPRDGEWTPLAQWQSFRATFGAVLTWPIALWR